MKKIYLLFIVLTASLSSKAQYVTLADPDFAIWLMNLYPGCFSGFEMDTTCFEIMNEESLALHNTDLDFIENLDGIQYFKSLKNLEISGFTVGNPNSNDVKIIPAFPKSVKSLKCANTLLENLPPLPDSLIFLHLFDNDSLVSVPPFPNNLKTAFVLNSPTALPLLSPTLEYLEFEYLQPNILNQIIPLLPEGLRILKCGGFANLGFQQNELPDSLRHLDVYSSNLNTFPLLNDSLSYCNIPASALNFLNAFPLNLDTLVISEQLLPQFPALPEDLKQLDLRTVTNLNCLPHLPPLLNRLLLPYNGSIRCIPNSVSGLQTFQFPIVVTLPLCSPINNPNHCPSGPVITGTVFYDNNSNGVKDAGDNFRSGVAVSHSNGTVAYSNAAGYFELSGDIGTNNISLSPPPFYSSLPNSGSYNFSTYDTLVFQSYALQPAVTADSVVISVIPDVSARPGFSHRSLLVWENVGTTTVTPAITLRYNNAQLSFTGSVPAGATSNGNTITIPAVAIVPGEIKTVSVQFAVSASAPLGDTIQFIGKAQAGSAIMMDSAYSIIRGSYDPNDKNATPVLSPQQVAEGTWINYLVRFQNTGNDTAINVVVTDTLDAQLDLSSLQVMGASHPAVTKRNGRNLSLEFYNIMLPDSNVNEPASHGYIRFRAKPLSSVVAGGIIPNYADIYFDYNSPVTTNTTNTTVRATVVPLSLLSFKALQDGEKALLRWSTASEINTRAFEIEQGSDGRIFNRVGIVAALGSGDHAYYFATPILPDISYFRLKMIDIDGRYSNSETRTLKKVKSEKAVYVVTNPARNILTINCLNKMYVGSKAVLIDQSGRKVKSFTILGGLQQVDIAAMEPGLYYLKTAGGVVDFVVGR